jgi:hypothetical protein
MEKIDPSINTITLGSTLYEPTVSTSNLASDSKIIQPAYVSIITIFIEISIGDFVYIISMVLNTCILIVINVYNY